MHMKCLLLALAMRVTHTQPKVLYQRKSSLSIDQPVLTPGEIASRSELLDHLTRMFTHEWGILRMHR